VPLSLAAFGTIAVVGSGAIFFYCGATVGLVRYAVEKRMNIERDPPQGWKGFIDAASVLRDRRLNLWLGLGCLVVAIALTTGWAIDD
jgi:hypothetical protein